MSDAERIDWFWKIIDRTKPGKADQDEQLALLHSELEKLSPHELEVFGANMDRILTDSYSWDLWGAAYVIMGGASDDSFEYFRVWMISQGQQFFETAKADPDKLADVFLKDTTKRLISSCWRTRQARSGPKRPGTVRTRCRCSLR